MHLGNHGRNIVCLMLKYAVMVLESQLTMEVKSMSEGTMGPYYVLNAIPGTLLIYITVIPPSVWYIADALLSIFLSCGSVHHYSLVIVLGTWEAFVLVITSLLAILVITSLLAHFS